MSIKKYEEFHKKSGVQKKLIGESNFTYSIILKNLSNLIKGEKRLKILDYGSGVGTIAMYLSNIGHDVTGVDISKKATEIAKKSAEINHLSQINFFQVDEWNRKVKKHKMTFDLIICFEVLEHIKNDSLVLKQFRNHLKEKGTLILSVPSVNAPLYKLGLTRKFDERVGHLRRYNESNLRKLVENNGYIVERVEKTEGIIRNSLFVFRSLGLAIKLIRGPITHFINSLDDISKKLIGESDIFIYIKKR